MNAVGNKSRNKQEPRKFAEQGWGLDGGRVPGLKDDNEGVFSGSEGH